MKKELDILICCVALWCLGIIVVPFFSPIEELSVIVVVLRKFYGVLCHQLNSRSFHILGQPFAVCVRCSSIYFGFLCTLIAVRLLPKIRQQKIVSLYIVIVSTLPMLFDVVFSFTTQYESNTVSRIITGLIFGCGMALLLWESLVDIIFLLFLQTNSTSHGTKT